MVANAREAVRANGIEIALVEREIGTAVFACQGPFVPWSAAVGAADHGGIVSARLVDGEYFAAMAAELLANGKLRGIVLAIAVRASDEEPGHGDGPFPRDGLVLNLSFLMNIIGVAAPINCVLVSLPLGHRTGTVCSADCGKISHSPAAFYAPPKNPELVATLRVSACVTTERFDIASVSGSG